MATLPVNNPNLPFVGRLPGNCLSPGVMLRIQGYMTNGRFSINLQKDPSIDPLGDVALHVDFRISENAVVRNHHLADEGWIGPEERHGGFPLIPGQNYEILILAMSHCYKIAVNGRHFCEFNHRLPLHTVHYVHIKGDTIINSIRTDWDVNQGPVPSAPPISAPSYPIYNQAPGYIPPPTQYAPNYGAVPAEVIHQPIYAAPPYPTQHAQAPPYGNPPPYAANVPSGAPYGGVPVMMNKEYISPPETGNHDKTKKYLKYAAIGGGVGLGAYALTKIIDDALDSD